MTRAPIDREMLFSRVLPLVRRPQRYAGGEIHSVRKDPGSVRARMALSYPDLYEIGACNLGLSILYHVINAVPGFQTERVFMVEKDMEEQLKRHGLPLYGLESLTPLAAFDLIGFTLQYELTYSNIPAMLGMGGVPLRSEERGQGDPIVMAGGPCASNPMPLSALADAFCIGDGEEAVPACLKIVSETPSREERLRRMATVPGIWVPAFSKGPVRPARVAELKASDTPVRQLVPLFSPVHNRYQVEVMRGCPHGCRFCSASFYYRPVRERPPADALSQMDTAVREEGWRDLSLLSLSTADYTPLRRVMAGGVRNAHGREVEFSLPSTRIDRLTTELFREMDLTRRTGITLAPEAGSERLRRVINKPFTGDEIVDNVRLALESGFQVIKLYFMAGLPTETDGDIDELITLIGRIQLLLAKSKGRTRLNISVSPFCPKPGTPFEAESLLAPELLDQRMERIRNRVRHRQVQVSTGDSRHALLETVIARAGAEMGAVLIAAAEKGLTLQGWSEHFNYDAWLALFAERGINIAACLEQGKLPRPLPWESLRTPELSAFLREELSRAMAGEITPDCSEGCAFFCGACGHGTAPVFHKADAAPEAVPGPAAEPVPEQRAQTKKQQYLFHYAKGPAARFIPHRDMFRLLERAFRVTGAPLAYSEGFSPHPRMSFFCALPLGLTGEQEMFTADFNGPLAPGAVLSMNPHLPEGLSIVALEEVDRPITEGHVRAAEYEADLPEGDNARALERFMALAARPAEVESKSGLKTIDIRPRVKAMSLAGNRLRMVLSAGAAEQLRPADLLKQAFGLSAEEILCMRITRKRLVLC